MLYKEPFMNSFFHYQDIMAFCLCYPASRFLDEFASAYITVTEEMERPYQRFIHYFIIGPISLILGLMSLPFAILGAIFRTTVERFRRPYVYRTSKTWKSESPYLKKSYTFCTTNVCLGPEYVCRMNNLRHNKLRAKQIGVVLTDGNVQVQADLSTKCNGKQTERQEVGDQVETKEFNHDILTRFPPLDFVLMQEAFNRSCTNAMTDILLKDYPYVVQNVTVNSFKSNMHALNSGLAFASKYPIQDVDFKFYEDSWSQCWLTAKGLLMVKVLLGRRGKRSFVGFISNTHLQSYQGKRKIIPKQLDNVMEWIQEFKERNTKSNDVVVFDVVGGDFNFDNMSPGDRETASHQIFDNYVDLGREYHGKDHDWTVGTTLRQSFMNTKEATSPAGLKTVLDDPTVRPLYVLNADLARTRYGMLTELPPMDEKGQCILTPASGRRRIDRLMFKEFPFCKPAAFNTVTQLAGLTDHLPVTLTLELDMKKINSAIRSS